MLIVATAPVPQALTVALCNSLSISIVSRLPPKHGPVRAIRRFSGQERDLCRKVHSRLGSKHRMCIMCPLVGRDRGVSVGGLRSKCRRLYQSLPRCEVDHIRKGVGTARGSTRVRTFVSNRARVLITAAIVRIKIGIPGTSIVIVRGTRQFKLTRLRRLHNHMKHKTSRSCYVLIAGCRLDRSAHGHVHVVARAGSNFRVTRTSLGLHKPKSLRKARRDNISFSLHLTGLTGSKRVLRLTHSATRGILSRSPCYTTSGGRVV